jgi:S-adenosylmethionine synthetase
MSRYIAKNIVAADLCDRCEVQLAYAIGVPFPVSVMIDCFGTEKENTLNIGKAVQSVFDLSPAGIIKTLNLKQPVYQQTAAYGHFGRKDFSWEKTDKVEELTKALR